MKAPTRSGQHARALAVAGELACAQVVATGDVRSDEATEATAVARAERVDIRADHLLHAERGIAAVRTEPVKARGLSRGARGRRLRRLAIERRVVALAAAAEQERCRDNQPREPRACQTHGRFIDSHAHKPAAAWRGTRHPAARRFRRGNIFVRWTPVHATARRPGCRSAVGRAGASASAFRRPAGGPACGTSGRLQERLTF